MDERLRELWRRASAPDAPCEDVVSYGVAKQRAGERDVSPLELDVDACRLARQLAAAWAAGERVEVRYREPLVSTVPMTMPAPRDAQGRTIITARPIPGSDCERWIVAAAAFPLMPGHDALPRDSREQEVGDRLHAAGMDWWVRRGAIVVRSPELIHGVGPSGHGIQTVLVAIPAARRGSVEAWSLRAPNGEFVRGARTLSVAGWYRGVPYQDVVAMSGHPLRQWVILPQELASVRALTKRGNRWA